jgi:diguanylate cyclase (GGDEF)-like protein
MTVELGRIGPPVGHTNRNMTKPVWFASLRVRLLAILVCIQVVFLAVALLGLDSFLQRVFERTAEARTADLGRIIKSALRQQMLRRPDLALDQTLSDLARNGTIRRIWIIDKNGRVAHATDDRLVGTLLDKQRDPTCVACHTGGSTRREHTWFARTDATDPVIRHAETIANEPACQQCHDASVRVTGIVLVEETTGPFQRALTTVHQRLLGTGLITLVALIVGTLGVTGLLVIRPVGRLMAGVRRLATGDLSTRVTVRGRGEIADLTSAFNTMAEDLGRNINEVRNKTAELSIVYSILERVTKSIELSELKAVVLQTFVEVLEADDALLISRLSEHSGVEVLTYARGVARIGSVRGDPNDDVVLPASLRAGFVRAWLHDDLPDPVVAPDARTIALPITSSQALALLILRRDHAFSTGQANLTLLTLVARHASVAFDNARLYTLAVTDPLTHLFTVRLFHERLDDCVLAWHQNGVPFALIMLDLDRFKAVNDMYGHPTGDRVLKATAAALARSLRVVDSGYRLGGDEFAALLPGVQPDALGQIADRFGEEIRKASVLLDTGGRIAVTASIGFASCPEHGRSAQALIAAADAALYCAKQEGRGRACSATATLATTGGDGRTTGARVPYAEVSSPR